MGKINPHYQKRIYLADIFKRYTVISGHDMVCVYPQNLGVRPERSGELGGIRTYP
jgi:hypothetical protein